MLRRLRMFEIFSDRLISKSGVLIMKNESQACTERREEITRAELPLSCPARDLRVWDAHPRVYLPIEATGEYRCPYCSTLYVLKDFVE